MTIDPQTYQNYLRDLGFLMRELASDSKAKMSQTGNAFDDGYSAAIHRVVSLMQQQADTFGIPHNEICLDGLDPDEDLVYFKPTRD